MAAQRQEVEREAQDVLDAAILEAAVVKCSTAGGLGPRGRKRFEVRDNRLHGVQRADLRVRRDELVVVIGLDAVLAGAPPELLSDQRKRSRVRTLLEDEVTVGMDGRPLPADQRKRSVWQRQQCGSLCLDKQLFGAS